MLGYKNPRKAILDHCSDRGEHFVTPLQMEENKVKKYRNEGNLYRLIAKSKIEGAEEFESWIFEEEEWILEKDVATVLGYKNTKVRGY